MSTLCDHAFPMHLHLHPQIAQLNLCLSSLGLGVCLSKAGAGAVVPFCRPRYSRAIVLNLGIPWSKESKTRFCSGSGKNANTDYCLCEPPDPPGLGLARRVFWYPCMSSAGTFCPHVSSLGENSRTEMHSLPTCCQWYSWNQDGIRSNFFHQRY